MKNMNKRLKKYLYAVVSMITFAAIASGWPPPVPTLIEIHPVYNEEVILHFEYRVYIDSDPSSPGYESIRDYYNSDHNDNETHLRDYCEIKPSNCQVDFDTYGIDPSNETTEIQ